MPTAGRLAAAIALAVLGGYVAYLIFPLFDEGSAPSYLYPLCVLAGVWSGWVVIGKRAGRGYTSGLGNGITGVLAMVFWISFVMSAMDMISKSMRRSYDGPVEAIVNVFEIMLEYALELYTNEVGMVLAIGAVAAGLFTEFFAKRFP